MPHDNQGRIFIDTSVTPNKGIDVCADIAYVLGRNTGDVGQLCGDVDKDGNVVGAINPWALYKPARGLSVGFINRTINLDSLGLGDANDIPGPPYATTIQGFINLYADTENLWGTERAHGWRYLRPRGANRNPKEWYRLFDFLPVVNGEVQSGYGYYHRAASPFGNFDGSSRVFHNGGTISYFVEKTLPQGDVDNTQIVLGDFNSILTSAWKLNYFGVLLVPDDTSKAFYIIGNKDERIFDDMAYRGHEKMRFESNFAGSNVGVGRYTVYPFLTNVALPSTRYITMTYAQRNTTLSYSRRLFSMPGVTPITLDVFEHYIEINFVNTPTASPSGDFSTAFTIKSNYDEIKTVTNFMLKFRKPGTSGYTTARQPGEVFYDNEYMYNDEYPSGIRSTVGEVFLAAMTLSPGVTYRRPDGSLLWLLTMPDMSLTKLQIGCQVGVGTPAYAETNIRVPVSGGNGLETA